MKRWLLLFVLVFFAASPINSSDFVEGDVFFVEESEYSVLTTLANGSEFSTPAGGRLVKIDDCLMVVEEYFCVADSSNESVSIDFYSLSFEENNSDDSDDVDEEESLAPLSDFLSVEVEFVEDVVVGSSYNFSLEAAGKQSGNDSDLATLSVVLPKGLVVEEFSGFEEYEQGVFVDLLLNQTTTASFRYLAQSAPAGPIRLFVEAEVNGTQYVREFVYNFSGSVASPLRLEADFAGSRLQVREDFPVSVRVVNNNSFPVSVDFAARSVLVDFEDSVQVPANDSQEVDFVLFANNTGSFGVSVFLEYELFEQSFSSREFFSLSSEEVVVDDLSQDAESDSSSGVRSNATVREDNSSSLSPSGPRGLLRGPSELAVNESGLLVFSAQEVPVGAGELTWLRGQEVLGVVNVSSSDGVVLANYSVSRGGSYEAVLVVVGVEVSSSYIVSQPASRESFNVSSEPEPSASSNGWSWWLLGGFLAVLLVGLWLVWRVRSTRFEESLLEDYEVVLSWHPRTQHEAVVREQLLIEIRTALEENS